MNDINSIFKVFQQQVAKLFTYIPVVLPMALIFRNLNIWAKFVGIQVKHTIVRTQTGCPSDRIVGTNILRLRCKIVGFAAPVGSPLAADYQTDKDSHPRQPNANSPVLNKSLSACWVSEVT